MHVESAIAERIIMLLHEWGWETGLEKLRSEMYARIIEKAEKEYKIPITKKPDTK